MKAGWRAQRLPDTLPEAIAEAERLNKQLDAWRDGEQYSPTTAKAGTVEDLIQKYKNSRHWRDLASKTQQGYEYSFRIILKALGDIPVRAISPSSVQKFYESMKSKPAKAKAVITTLRLLFSHAIRIDMITFNPAQNPGIKNKSEKGKIWDPEAVRAMAISAEEQGHYSIASAILFNEWFGQRMGDVVSIKLSDYQDGIIKISQNKTGSEVELPIDLIPPLKDRITKQIEYSQNRKSIYMFSRPDGKAYLTDHFSRIIKRSRAQAIKNFPDADLEDLVFKDLRHTAVTRLGEAEAPIQMIASITGHSFKNCTQILDRYNIRTSKMAVSAIKKRLDFNINQGGKQDDE